MMRESRERWKRRVLAWQRSGLSCKAFAEKEGVRYTTLGWWKWRLREELEAQHDEPLEFVELQVAEPQRDEQAPLLELHLGGEHLKLSVPVGFHAATLRRLVDLLQERGS